MLNILFSRIRLNHNSDPLIRDTFPSIEGSSIHLSFSQGIRLIWDYFYFFLFEFKKYLILIVPEIVPWFISLPCLAPRLHSCQSSKLDINTYRCITYFLNNRFLMWWQHLGHYHLRSLSLKINVFLWSLHATNHLGHSLWVPRFNLFCIFWLFQSSNEPLQIDF